jgi:hypothetical protein
MSEDLPAKPDWKIAADRERQEMVDRLLGPLDSAYEEVGLHALVLAKIQKTALKAKRVSWQKIKGYLPVGLKLGPGYRVITPSERVEVFDPETGQMLVADPGETLIEHTGPDWPTVLKAADAIIKNRGWSGADKIEQTNQGTVIHVHTHVAKPLPLPAAFQQQIEEETDGQDE